MEIVETKKYHNIAYPFGKHIQHNYVQTVALVEEFIERHLETLLKYKTIRLICRGSSGALMAGIAYPLLIKALPDIAEITINHIKKEGEKSHANAVSGLFDATDTHIFIDDFVDTGNTIIKTHEQITKYYKQFGYEFNKFDYVILGSCGSNKTHLFENLTKIFFTYIIEY